MHALLKLNCRFSTSGCMRPRPTMYRYMHVMTHERSITSAECRSTEYCAPVRAWRKVFTGLRHPTGCYTMYSASTAIPAAICSCMLLLTCTNAYLTGVSHLEADGVQPEDQHSVLSVRTTSSLPKSRKLLERRVLGLPSILELQSGGIHPSFKAAAGERALLDSAAEGVLAISHTRMPGSSL